MSSSSSLLVRGYEVVIGFETHAQLSTRSKIFSRAATAFGAEPNTQACAVDLALPGTLPVMNRAAVERAIRFGLSVGSHIAESSVFARKNYFYPDLPKGYQISQFEIPVVQGGEVSFFLGDEKKSVRLEVLEQPVAVLRKPEEGVLFADPVRLRPVDRARAVDQVLLRVEGDHLAARQLGEGADHVLMVEVHPHQLVALGLERGGDRGVLGADADVGTREADLGETGAVRVLAGDERRAAGGAARAQGQPRQWRPGQPVA